MIDLRGIQEIASLPIAIGAIFFMYKALQASYEANRETQRIASNHIDHNTAAVDKLSDYIGEQTITNREFQEWLRGYFTREESQRSNKAILAKVELDTIQHIDSKIPEN